MLIFAISFVFRPKRISCVAIDQCWCRNLWRASAWISPSSPRATAASTAVTRSSCSTRQIFPSSFRALSSPTSMSSHRWMSCINEILLYNVLQGVIILIFKCAMTYCSSFYFLPANSCYWVGESLVSISLMLFALADSLQLVKIETVVKSSRLWSSEAGLKASFSGCY